MENCTIYSHYLDFDKIVQIIHNTLPKAKIQQQQENENKQLIVTVKGGLFSKDKVLKLNYRERINPSYKLEKIECGLTENLAGMTNYIQSIPSSNEEVKHKFLFKVMSSNCEISFMAEPEINMEFGIIIKRIAKEMDCFLFAQPNNFFTESDQQHFLDKNLNLILDTKGSCTIDDIEVNVETKYHDQPQENILEDQRIRKNKSEAFLHENGIKINKNLPAIISENEVELRSKDEIINRVYALLIISAKGEGVEQEHLIRAVEGKQINSFSPREEIVYNTATLEDNDRAYATWRYESLYTLLWALGIMDEHKFPSEICNVQEVVSKVFQPTRDEFIAQVQLRSTEEILNELDKTYRMNWACVDARIHGQEVEGNIIPSIIYERHYALNWLTKFENQEWDDIQTPT